MLVVAVVMVVSVESPWLHYANAVYWGVVCNQLVFVGHDAGHRAVFGDRRDVTLGFLLLPLLGMSYSWWVDTHNKHHGLPNQENFDPSISFQYLAFSRKQAAEKTGLARKFIRHQSCYFLPLIALYPVYMRFASIMYLIRRRDRKSLVEALLGAIHFPLYFGLVFMFLDPWQGMTFILVHQMVFGMCLFSAFGPNHIGQIILDEGHELNFLQQQVSTAQNVQSSLFADFWFGGLNHQIEHHLFPRVARNQLRHVRPIVKQFCADNDIPYKESRFPRCLIEILRFMHWVGEPLRTRSPAPIDDGS